MKRGHGLTLGALTALLIALLAPRAMRHAPPPVPVSAPHAETPVTAAAPRGAPRAAAEFITHPGIGFHSHQRLMDHFHRHGRELGCAEAAAYLQLAQALRDRPAGGDVLELRRADGTTTRFDRGSGAFLAFDDDLVLRTFFRPRDGEAYFHRQAEREHR